MAQAKNIKPTRADGRRKSKLTLVAEAAARKAKRDLLLETLTNNNWNLSDTAKELELAGPSDVVRAIRDAGLSDEYGEAKDQGLIIVGKKRSVKNRLAS